MQEVTSFAHALSDTTRWRIVQLLLDEALCVCELADILEMPQSTVSNHLQVLRKSQLLLDGRCEKWIYYRLERKCRRFILNIGNFFGVSAVTDSVLQSDTDKCIKCLKERQRSSCPGPRLLASADTPA